MKEKGDGLMMNNEDGRGKRGEVIKGVLYSGGYPISTKSHTVREEVGGYAIISSAIQIST